MACHYPIYKVLKFPVQALRQRWVRIGGTTGDDRDSGHDLPGGSPTNHYQYYHHHCHGEEQLPAEGWSSQMSKDL